MRRRYFLAALFWMLSGCHSSATSQRRVLLIGDSTVADFPAASAPMTGWGQALRQILHTRAKVLNFAVPGSSTRRFAESHWPAVRSKLVPGDLLLIQFGHVDALPDTTRHTEPFADYSKLLQQFINESREMGAQPVLVTPVARYKFEHGHQVDTHGSYPVAMRKVASINVVPLIDLTEASSRALQQLGESRARAWFMLTHDGHDAVHLNRTGANEVAGIVQKALVQAQLL
jgi:DNA sulfur modification protein DndE